MLDWLVEHDVWRSRRLPEEDTDVKQSYMQTNGTVEADSRWTYAGALRSGGNLRARGRLVTYCDCACDVSLLGERRIRSVLNCLQQ